MKKLVLAILVALIASFDLCAVFVSVNLINANGSFDSPSNLQKIGISSDFAVRFNYLTDVDNIMFLANPIPVLAFSSQPYVSFLLAQQTSFFDANRGVTGLFNSYDANAPVYDSTYPEASVDAFKRYLRDSFLRSVIRGRHSSSGTWLLPIPAWSILLFTESLMHHWRCMDTTLKNHFPGDGL